MEKRNPGIQQHIDNLMVIALTGDVEMNAPVFEELAKLGITANDLVDFDLATGVTESFLVGRSGGQQSPSVVQGQETGTNS